MGQYWQIKCPFCNAIIAEGRGYGDTIPDVWVPFIRCGICGGLIRTGVKEYLTIPVNERIQLKRTISNNKYIEKSLDRTNNKDYVLFLQKKGFTFYPITEADKERFENVRFDLYINQQPSTTATQSLYNIGILIEEQNLDKETGGLKKEVLDKNKKNYELSQKIFRWSIGVGTIAGFLFAIIFGTINPNSYLFLIGVVLGIGSAAATNYGMKYYYKNKEINSEKSSITRQTNKNENAGRNISYLKQLYDDGVISKEEYQEKSKKILDKNGK